MTSDKVPEKKSQIKVLKRIWFKAKANGLEESQKTGPFRDIIKEQSNDDSFTNTINSPLSKKKKKKENIFCLSMLKNGFVEKKHLHFKMESGFGNLLILFFKDISTTTFNAIDHIFNISLRYILIHIEAFVQRNYENKSVN